MHHVPAVQELKALGDAADDFFGFRCGDRTGLKALLQRTFGNIHYQVQQLDVVECTFPGGQAAHDMGMIQVPHGDEFAKLGRLIRRKGQNQLDGHLADVLLPDHFLSQKDTTKGTIAEQALKMVFTIHLLPLE